jgi:hypothetical protein
MARTPSWLDRVGLVVALPLWIAGGVLVGLVLCGMAWWIAWDDVYALREAMDADED